MLTFVTFALFLLIKFVCVYVCVCWTIWMKVVDIMTLYCQLLKHVYYEVSGKREFFYIILYHYYYKDKLMFSGIDSYLKFVFYHSQICFFNFYLLQSMFLSRILYCIWYHTSLDSFNIEQTHCFLFSFWDFLLLI